ncbi:hypothetical protein D3C78_17820 [compost metagenome]
MTASTQIRPAAKIGSYFNERGKFKSNEPMFSRDKLLPGDAIMVYDEDNNRHYKAIITSSIMPEVIEYRKPDGQIGTYSAKAAYETVTIGNEQYPRIYLV